MTQQFHFWVFVQQKQNHHLEKISAPSCSLNMIHNTRRQPVLISRRMDKKAVGTYTQWSITQPLKRIHLNQF